MSEWKPGARINNKIRYYDIDWLRVLGMITIFLFHNARFFNDEGWHVKNFQTDFGMSVFVAVVAHFVMPLFFLLSAIAIYYALKKRTNSQFMREPVTILRHTLRDRMPIILRDTS
jgi:glucan biosynthesis protein C